MLFQLLYFNLFDSSNLQITVFLLECVYFQICRKYSLAFIFYSACKCGICFMCTFVHFPLRWCRVKTTFGLSWLLLQRQLLHCYKGSFMSPQNKVFYHCNSKLMIETVVQWSFCTSWASYLSVLLGLIIDFHFITLNKDLYSSDSLLSYWLILIVMVDLFPFIYI